MVEDTVNISPSNIIQKFCSLIKCYLKSQGILSQAWVGLSQQEHFKAPR